MHACVVGGGSICMAGSCSLHDWILPPLLDWILQPLLDWIPHPACRLERGRLLLDAAVSLL